MLRRRNPHRLCQEGCHENGEPCPCASRREDEQAVVAGGEASRQILTREFDRCWCGSNFAGAADGLFVGARKAGGTSETRSQRAGTADGAFGVSENVCRSTRLESGCKAVSA